jgi:hypothetical protein
MDWLPYVVLNASGIIVFIVAWWLMSFGTRWRLVAAGVVLGLIIFKSVLTWMPVWEATIFPFSGYIYLQSFWMPLLMMAFFGFAAPQLTVPWNRWVVAIIACGFYINLGLMGTWWMVDRPLLGQPTVPNAEHHLSQSTPFTCAPCAAAIAVSYIGMSISEQQMADYCLTIAERGTTRFNTYRGLMIALEKSPWRARMAHASVDDLCQPGQITVIDFPDIRHAITTVGVGDGVTLHDPLRQQPVRLSKEDLAERYGGVAIIIEKR